MFLLQVISYIFEMIMIILIGGFFTIYPGKLIEKYMKQSNGYREITFVQDNRNNKNSINKIARIFFSILIGLITVYLLVPYVLDFPKLLSGKFNYVSGYVNKVRTERKSLYEYVSIGGQEIKFVFSSNVERNKQYKIGYLPSTKRAIYGEIISNAKAQNNQKISFPLKQILVFLGILAAFVLLGLASPYLKFKLFGIVCLFFYPLYIYVYIKNGINYGTWLSFSNQGLFLLIIGIVTLLSLVLMYFGERRKDGDATLTMIFAQMAAVAKIFMIIAFFAER